MESAGYPHPLEEAGPYASPLAQKALCVSIPAYFNDMLLHFDTMSTQTIHFLSKRIPSKQLRVLQSDFCDISLGQGSALGRGSPNVDAGPAAGDGVGLLMQRRELALLQGGLLLPGVAVDVAVGVAVDVTIDGLSGSVDGAHIRTRDSGCGGGQIRETQGTVAKGQIYQNFIKPSNSQPKAVTK